MLSDDLSMLRVGVGEDILNEVVAVLVTRNIDQWNARTIKATLADTVEVATEKVNTTNLETFLNNLRSKLVHAVLGRVPDDMVNCPAAISWGSVLTNMLDAPVAKLAVGNNINASKNLFNAGPL